MLLKSENTYYKWTVYYVGSYSIRILRLRIGHTNYKAHNYLIRHIGMQNPESNPPT